MTTQPQPLAPAGPGAPQILVRKDDSVKIDALAPNLLSFLAAAGAAHLALFQRPLVVTSGNDSIHSKTSKHYQDKAVDLRSLDKKPAEQLLFAHILSWLGDVYQVMTFDERTKPNGPHWHCECSS